MLRILCSYRSLPSFSSRFAGLSSGIRSVTLASASLPSGRRMACFELTRVLAGTVLPVGCLHSAPLVVSPDLP